MLSPAPQFATKGASYMFGWTQNKRVYSHYKDAVTHAALGSEEDAISFYYPVFATAYRDLMEIGGRRLRNCLAPLAEEKRIEVLLRFRARTSMEWYHDWTKISVKHFAPPLSEEECFYVLAAGTFHPNGFFREACLRGLAAYSARALPYTLFATSDWVESIRILAAELFLTASPQMNAELWIACLPYYARLIRCARRPGDRRDEICRAFASALHTVDIDRMIRSTADLSPKVRRVAYSLWLREQVLDAKRINELLSTEKDPASQHLLLQAFLNFSHTQETYAFFLRSRSVIFRSMALASFVKQYGAQSAPVLAALCDPSQRIREAARFLMRSKNSAFPFTQHYREQISRHPTAGSLLGLGETGAREDATVTKPFVDSAVPSLRKAAFFSLVNLLGEDMADECHQRLLDENSGLSRPAFQAILRNRWFTNGGWYCAAYLHTDSAMQKARLMRILGSLSHWEILAPLLEISGRSREGAIAAETRLRRWVVEQRCFTAPNERQSSEILAALPHTIPYLPADLQANLRLALRQYGLDDC